jgi:hypothetical protein
MCDSFWTWQTGDVALRTAGFSGPNLFLTTIRGRGHSHVLLWKGWLMTVLMALMALVMMVKVSITCIYPQHAERAAYAHATSSHASVSQAANDGDITR